MNDIENLTDEDDLFSTVQLIGYGGFGKVYKAINRRTGDFIALKEVILDVNVACKQVRATPETISHHQKKKARNIFQKLKELLEREINQRILSNPFIIQNYGYSKKVEKNDAFIEDSLTYRLYMELCDTDLLKFLKLIDEQKLKVENIEYIIRQIALGIKYLHSLGLLHRDIKEANILLKDIASELDKNDGRKYRVKIADLGFLKEESHSLNGKMSVLGTQDYKAPEIDEGKYDRRVDIYSFGILLNNINTIAPLGNKWSSIIQKMKEENEEKRLTIEELLSFMDSLINTTKEEIESLLYMVDKSIIDDSSSILLVIKDELNKNSDYKKDFLSTFNSLWNMYSSLIGDTFKDPLESIYLASLKETERLLKLYEVNEITNDEFNISIQKAKICLKYVLKKLEEESLKDDAEFINDYGKNIKRTENALKLIERIINKCNIK